jgi:hypothetical protein
VPHLLPPLCLHVPLIARLRLRLQFVDAAMASAKALAPDAPPGPCVTACFINNQKRFAFVELRSMEEAANALGLSGLRLNGRPLQVRPPASSCRSDLSWGSQCLETFDS